jgi:hypothetical protein
VTLVIADIIIILLIVIPLGFALHMFSIWANNKLFKEVAKTLRLEFKKAKFFDDPEVSGEIAGCPIKVNRITKEETDFLHVKITPALKFPINFQITRETVLTKVQRMVGKKDIETWDDRFDDSMLLDADSPHILIGLLDAEIRGLIMVLSGASRYFEINSSGITAGIERTLRLKSGTAVKFIQLAAAIGQDLSKDVSMEERFAQNIKADPIPQVRINNILALTIYAPGKPGMDSILKEALDDPSPGVQVEAAKHLEEQGMNHLVKILETRRESLEPTLIKEILQTLQENKFSKSIPVLEKIYHSDRGDDLKKSILQAFAVFGDTSLNSFLLVELEKENPGFTLYIIEALGTCGQVEAVEKLFKTGKKTLNLITRRKVKEAITRIQSRLGDVEKGWLSMTYLQDIDGALSLDSDPGEGALSAAEEKPRRHAKGREEK